MRKKKRKTDPNKRDLQIFSISSQATMSLFRTKTEPSLRFACQSIIVLVKARPVEIIHEEGRNHSTFS